MISTGSLNMYTDAHTAYRREQLQRDFAAINRAAEQRADRRARAAEARAAGKPASTSASSRRTWIARWHRVPRPVAR